MADDRTLDSEAAKMLTQYEDEPTSIWLYTDMSVKDRMAWAYLAADAFKSVPFKKDMVRAFVEAMTKVTDPPETFWEQIKDKDDARANYLGQLDWDIETVPLDEIGVYPRFSSYPNEWCKGNVAETAKRITEDESHPDKKAKLLQMSEKYQTILKFLPPILVPGGILRGEQPGYELTKYTCDDGNHRLVVAALAGEKEAVCFVGKAKEHKEVPVAELEPQKAESLKLGQSLSEAVRISGPTPVSRDPRQASLLPPIDAIMLMHTIGDRLMIISGDTRDGDGCTWSGQQSIHGGILRNKYEILFRDPDTGGWFIAEFFSSTDSAADAEVILLRVHNSNNPNDAELIRNVATEFTKEGYMVGQAGPNLFVYDPNRVDRPHDWGRRQTEAVQIRGPSAARTDPRQLVLFTQQKRTLDTVLDLLRRAGWLVNDSQWGDPRSIARMYTVSTPSDYPIRFSIYTDRIFSGLVVLAHVIPFQLVGKVSENIRKAMQVLENAGFEVTEEINNRLWDIKLPDEPMPEPKAVGESTFSLKLGQSLSEKKKFKKIKGAPSILVVGLLPGQAERVRQKFRNKANLAFVVEKDVSAPIPPRADWAVGLTSFISHKQDGKVAGVYGKRYLRVIGGVSSVIAKINNILAGKPYESLPSPATLREAVNIAGPSRSQEQPGQQRFFGSSFDDMLDLLADNNWQIERDPDLERLTFVTRGYSVFPRIMYGSTVRKRNPVSIYLYARQSPGHPVTATVMSTGGFVSEHNLLEIIKLLKNSHFDATLMTSPTSTLQPAWSVKLPTEPVPTVQTEAVYIQGPTPERRDVPGQMMISPVFIGGLEVEKLTRQIESIGLVKVPEASSADTIVFTDRETGGIVKLVIQSSVGGNEVVGLMPNFDPHTVVSEIPEDEFPDIRRDHELYMRVATALQAMEDVETRSVQADELLGEAIQIAGPTPKKLDTPGQMRLGYVGGGPSIASGEYLVNLLRGVGYQQVEYPVEIPQPTTEFDWKRYKLLQGIYVPEVYSGGAPVASSEWHKQTLPEAIEVLNSLMQNEQVTTGKVKFYHGEPRPNAPTAEFDAEGNLTAAESAWFNDMNKYGFIAQFGKPIQRKLAAAHPTRVREIDEIRHSRHGQEYWVLMSPGPKSRRGYVFLEHQYADQWSGEGSDPLDAVSIRPVAGPSDAGRKRDQQAYVDALNLIYKSGITPLYVDPEKIGIRDQPVANSSACFFSEPPTEATREQVMTRVSKYDPHIGDEMLEITPLGEAVQIAGPSGATETPGHLNLFLGRNFYRIKNELLKRGYKDEGRLGLVDSSAILSAKVRLPNNESVDGYMSLISYEDDQENIGHTFLFPYHAPDKTIVDFSDKLATRYTGELLDMLGYEIALFGAGFRVDAAPEEFTRAVESSLG